MRKAELIDLDDADGKQVLGGGGGGGGSGGDTHTCDIG